MNSSLKRPGSHQSPFRPESPWNNRVAMNVFNTNWRASSECGSASGTTAVRYLGLLVMFSLSRPSASTGMFHGDSGRNGDWWN